MATVYHVRNNHHAETFYDVVTNESKATYSIDFAVWAEDNSAVSTAEWEVVSGSAAVSGDSVSSNVASALITFTATGTSLIKIKATGSGGEITVVYLAISATEPTIKLSTSDYGR